MGKLTGVVVVEFREVELVRVPLIAVVVKALEVAEGREEENEMGVGMVRLREIVVIPMLVMEF